MTPTEWRKEAGGDRALNRPVMAGAGTENLVLFGPGLARGAKSA